MILQHPEPEDFVIATGEMHSVREFCTLAFAEAGITLRWEGEGVDEKGIDVATGKVLVEVDKKYFRPAEVEQERCWGGTRPRHPSRNWYRRWWHTTCVSYVS